MKWYISRLEKTVYPNPSHVYLYKSLRYDPFQYWKTYIILQDFIGKSLK